MLFGLKRRIPDTGERLKIPRDQNLTGQSELTLPFSSPFGPFSVTAPKLSYEYLKNRSFLGPFTFEARFEHRLALAS